MKTFCCSGQKWEQLPWQLSAHHVIIIRLSYNILTDELEEKIVNRCNSNVMANAIITIPIEKPLKGGGGGGGCNNYG